MKHQVFHRATTIFVAISLAALAGLAFSFNAAHAATIQFDFTAGAGSYTGSESPGHTSGDVTGTTWNMADGDVATGLLWSDGTAATGVQVDLGSGVTIDWSGGVSKTAYTGGTSGVYDTDLMRDWHYTSGDNNLGARVSGLAAGTYRVFALIREPNQLTRVYDAAIGVNISAMGDAGVVETTSIAAATGDTWIDGENFAATDVTVSGTGDWVTVIVDPICAQWGTIEGLQITLIPEPSAVALFGLGGLGLILRRRRKA